MSYQNILFDIEDGIARLTLNRPDKLNSFTAAMHAEVRDALDKLKGDASMRVLVLTGAGRGFCAGQDLADRAVAPGAAPADLGESIEKNYGPLVLRLRSPAILRSPPKSANFIEPFCKLGLIQDTGGTYFLPRLLGTARAMGLAMLGDKLSAEQAVNWG